jgi:acetyl esterase/lipase
MKKILRYAGVTVTVVLAVAAAGLLIGLYNYGRPAHPPRPDLVKLPPGVPDPPRGYPSKGFLIAAYMLGIQEVLDPAYPWPLLPGVMERKDIEYGRVGDTPLLLNLHAPENLEAAVPGLIFIHGGGWYSGHRNDYRYYTIRYAHRGFVAVSISYRYSTEAGFPGCVEDAKCAVRWMRANAAELHVDPDRICVIGGSAGAHLAMMAGYSSDEPALEGIGGWQDVSSRPDAVADLYGPTDATVDGLRDLPLALRFMKKTYEEDPERYVMASPIFHLDKDDPPTLVIQGALDEIVPAPQSDQLVEKLEELGIKHYYGRLDGWPHTLDAAVQVNEWVQRCINAFLSEVFAMEVPDGVY